MSPKVDFVGTVRQDSHGQRYGWNHHLGDRFVRGGARLLCKPLTPAISDPLCGLFAFRRDAVMRSSTLGEGNRAPCPILACDQRGANRLALEVYVRSASPLTTKNVREVGFHYVDRQRGESTKSFNYVVLHWYQIRSLYWYALKRRLSSLPKMFSVVALCTLCLLACIALFLMKFA